ncbi:hypothetical protein A2U01_0075772, partial [Trifolium medium]|nr:hypothetical protein [Trifolium medium]
MACSFAVLPACEFVKKEKGMTRVIPR